MGEIIVETDIPREEGYLYYCGTSKEGMIVIGKSKMARGRRKKKGGSIN